MITKIAGIALIAMTLASPAFPRAKGPGASGTSMFTHPSAYAQPKIDPAGLFAPCGTVPQWPCLSERGLPAGLTAKAVAQ